MHFEVLVEDSSGAKVVAALLPQVLGAYADPHTWRIKAYKGMGRVPRGLKSSADPAKRILLDRLPRILRGYSKTPGIDAVVVVLDSDRRDCVEFLRELKGIVEPGTPETLFRLAIEEIEAWYLGDREAILAAYPNAKREPLDRYRQDSVCGTWELLADAIHPGGAARIVKAGWPVTGQVKHEWAERIAPHLRADRNRSPSLCKFAGGLLRLTQGAQ